MIWLSLIGALGGLANAVFAALNIPKVTTLPFVDGYLSSGMGNIYFMVHFFPPLGILVGGFLFVLGWKLLLLILRMVPVLGRALTR